MFKAMAPSSDLGANNKTLGTCSGTLLWPPWRDDPASSGKSISMAIGHKGSTSQLEQSFLFNPKEASFGAEAPRFPGWRHRKVYLPTTGSKLVSALTVWDQSDVLGVGAQEVLHGAPEEQGLMHPVQLQGAVDAVQLPLRVVRGVGLHADLSRLVPQQPGGLSLGAAPGPQRIKEPER